MSSGSPTPVNNVATGRINDKLGESEFNDKIFSECDKEHPLTNVGGVDMEFKMCLLEKLRHSGDIIGNVSNKPVGVENKYGYYENGGYCYPNDGIKTGTDVKTPMCKPDTYDSQGNYKNANSGWVRTDGRGACGHSVPDQGFDSPPGKECRVNPKDGGYTEADNFFGFVPPGLKYNDNPNSPGFMPTQGPLKASTALKIPTPKKTPKKKSTSTSKSKFGSMSRVNITWIVIGISVLLGLLFYVMQNKKSKVISIQQKIAQFGRTIKSIKKF